MQECCHSSLVRLKSSGMPTPAIFHLRPFAVLVCLSVVLTAHAENDYKLGPESTNRFAGVPQGRVEKFQFTESKVFPDTTRDCWIYIPAQYDGSKPAAATRARPAASACPSSSTT